VVSGVSADLGADSISIDSTSSIVIGGGAGQAGPLLVATGATLNANGDMDGNLAGAGAVNVIPQGGQFFVFPSPGQFEISDASAFAGTIVLEYFQGGATLILDHGDLANSSITMERGTVDLRSVLFPWNYTFYQPAYDPQTGALTVDTDTLNVGAGLVATDFLAASDGEGGTQVIQVAGPVPCFVAGTRIATERGAIPVQHLRVGDTVCLAEGGSAPVVWLGHRRVDCRRHPHHADVWPVRIVAHAFGVGRPVRDLLLSPDHAVFIDGVLIPVRYLLNDATVRQEKVASVSYWHVELSKHTVLLAEGLSTESYLDTGNRAAFDNGGVVVTSHPEFARSVWNRQGCGPLVTDLVYRRLIGQALALGWTATDAGSGGACWLPAARPGRLAGRHRRTRVE
jgi:hypothetical protein